MTERLIEIENFENEIEQISGGVASKVDENIDAVVPLLKRVVTPIKESFNELNKGINIEKIEVELGLGFEASGNAFIVKGKGKANLSIKLTILSIKEEE